MPGADATTAADPSPVQDDAGVGSEGPLVRPGPARPSPAQVRAQVRRWAPVAVGLVAVVGGWRLSMTALYVLGLGVVVIGLLRALRDRRRVGVAVAALMVTAAVAGPWVGVQRAYAPVGVDVSRSVESYSGYVGTYREATVMRTGSTLVAVDADGGERWRTELPDLRYVVPTTADGFVVVLTDGLLGVDGSGAHVWSRPVAWEDELVGFSDGVLVELSCAADAQDAPCVWAGLDAAQGDVLWEVTGTRAPAWDAASAPASENYVVAAPGPLFATRGDDGGISVRDAATGAVVQAVPDDGRAVVLAGDAILLVTQGNDCSIDLVSGDDAAPAVPIDCASWLQLEYSISEPGLVVGDTLWATPLEETGTLVVDLEDGSLRQAGYSYWGSWYPYGAFNGSREPVHVLGGGIEAFVDQAGLTVRDPSTGEELWQVGVAADDVRSVQIGDELLVLSRYTRPLLLHEWFAPDDRVHIAVEVYDVRTGELLADIRPEGYPWSPVVAGERVLMDVGDLEGDVTLRLVGD